MTDNPPSLSLSEAAIGIHEMYRSLLNAGFDKKQALELCKAMIMAQQSGGSSS